MKLLTINWLSKAIALPLFATIFNILPAHADQIQRAPRISLEISRTSRLESLPAQIDLNLSIPVSASTIVPEHREPSNSIEPIWANLDRRRAVKTVTKRTSTTRSVLKRRDLSSPNLKLTTASSPDRFNRLKSGSNQL